MSIEDEISSPHPSPEGAKPLTPWNARDIGLTVVAGVAFILVSSPALFIGLSAAGISLSRTASFVLLGTDAYVSLSLAAWWICLQRHNASLESMGFSRLRWGPLAAMIPLAVGLLLANGLLVLLTSVVLGGSENPQSEALAPQGVLSTEDFLLLFLLIAVIAPVGEELLFRGMFYRYLRGRRGVAFAVILSAAVFSLAHVIPVLLPALFALGVALALVTERFASIYPAIALHALNNGISLVILYAATTRA